MEIEERLVAGPVGLEADLMGDDGWAWRPADPMVARRRAYYDQGHGRGGAALGGGRVVAGPVRGDAGGWLVPAREGGLVGA
ncbi:hypothetical protein NL676_031588 [Syzygium grande]|nr:hypothetical protein NL676_031588 [Syzygium grande]